MYSAKLLHGVGACLLALPLLAGPFETWHPRSPLPTANTLNGAAHGNGRFVVVGDNGTIVTSSNGVDWVLGQSGVSSHLNTILFADGRFAAGGNSGVILWSDDGVNWAPGSFPLDGDLSAIGFGVGTNFPGGLFVAICTTNVSILSDNIILTSTNGLTWQPSGCCFPSGLETRYSSMAFGNNLFVASGADVPGDFSATIDSFSGMSWTITFGLAGSVAFGNGLFVLARRFVVASNGVSLPVFTSATGSRWVPSSPTFSGASVVSRAACFGGGRFVVVGDRGLTAASLDGTNWTAQQVPTDAQLRAVAFGDGTFVAVGNGGFIISSSDAVSWTQRSKGTLRNLFAIAPADDGFIAVGSHGAIASSSDGVAWETFGAPTTNSLLAVIKVEGIYVTAGGNGTILSGDSLASLVTRVSGTSNALQGISHGHDRFVIVGDSGTILSSPNGVDWTAENSGTSGKLMDIVFGGGLFAAVGPDADVLTSSNGADWIPRPTGASLPLTEIVYGSGRFVASTGDLTSILDNAVYVVTSLDGVNWVPVHGVVPELETGTSYGTGYFVAFLRQLDPPFKLGASTDGISWTTHPLFPHFPPGTDIAFNNGTFVSVGRFGRISQADPVMRLRVTHDGMAHLAWEGPMNRRYGILASESPDEPNSWQEQTTIFSPPFSWTDPQSVGRSNRIYRVVLLPK